MNKLDHQDKYTNNDNYIFNSKTGRWVLKTGKVGKSLLYKNQSLMQKLVYPKENLFDDENEDIMLMDDNQIDVDKQKHQLDDLTLSFDRPTIINTKQIDINKKKRSNPIPLSLSITDTIIGTTNIGFNNGANIYDEKRNMIISCPSKNRMVLYDASTLKNLKTIKLKSSVVVISYNADSDNYLMGCAFGQIYSYNPDLSLLKLVLTSPTDSFILSMTYITPEIFIYSSNTSGQLSVVNLRNNTVKSISINNNNCWFLYYQKESKILYAGLSNGQLYMYNVNNISQIKLIQTIQAHKSNTYLTAITEINIQDRKYIATGGKDGLIKIWDANLGKLKLLKVIRLKANQYPSTIVYLQKYQALAVSCDNSFILFYSAPNGQLLQTIDLSMKKIRNLFAMETIDSLGAGDLTSDMIKIVKLSK